MKPPYYRVKHPYFLHPPITSTKQHGPFKYLWLIVIAALLYFLTK
jgi:hypothetical protein